MNSKIDQWNPNKSSRKKERGWESEGEVDLREPMKDFEVHVDRNKEEYFHERALFNIAL